MSGNSFFGRVSLIFLLGVILSVSFFSGAVPTFAAQNILDNETGGTCGNFGIWDADTKTCTLTADIYDSVFIKSNNITLDGNGHTIFRPAENWGPVGIYISSYSGVTIRNLIVDSTESPTIFSGPGISLYFASGNTIENVTVQKGRPGIKFAFGSNNNVITNSTVTGNRDAGIFCDSGPSNNQIVGNTINSNSGSGILFSNCDNNEIRGNTISRNVTGLQLGGIAGAGNGSDSNRVINNNFISNGTSASVAKGVGNVFGEPLPIGGNHWSNFDSFIEGCTDFNGNQICDLSYFFSGGRDDFPWTIQDGWVIPPVEPKTPVIIVPGIMGSRLNRVSDGEEVWPGGIKLLSKEDDYLDELILDASGNQILGHEMNTSEVVNNEFGKVVYGNLVNSFRDKGYIEELDLFTVPYDWRFDISSNVSKLQTVVNQALTSSFTGKVNIIAHSMGGLVVKEYLRQFPEVSGDINKLILAGVPQLGAVKAFKALNYGDNMGFEVGPIDILSPERIKIISQNMPGVYQLLPSRRYIDIVGGYLKDFRDSGKILSYDETKAFMTTDAELPDYRNPILLNLADTLHQAQDDQVINISEVHNLVGCQNPGTIGSIQLYSGNEIDIMATSGDGTVPFVSAMNNSGGFTNYFALYSEIKADHTGLVRNESLVGLIADIIEDKPITLPAGVSQASADCFKELPDPTKIIFSTHSPVELHVYDSSGRHTGPLPSGDIELGIPESNYYKIGENSFAFVPSGDLYRLVIKAIGLGDFDLKIKGYHGSNLKEVVTYLEVPIKNIETVAELNFTGFAGSLALLVDENGDSTPDQVVEPSTTLLGPGSDDIVPPEIGLFSPKSRDYLRSENVPIQFNVSDVGSGVAFSKVKLDGEEFSVNQIDLLLLGLGDHILSVTAYDKAGNPAVRAVSFRVVSSLEDTIINLEESFSRGWITRGSVKNNLLKTLKKAERVLKNPKFKTHPERESEKYRGILMDFLESLETQYNKGYVSKEALDLLKENTNWLLDNL